MSNKTIHSVYLIQHKTGCSAMHQFGRGSWDTPWFLTGDHVYRDKNGGRKGGTTRWLVARCNSTDCPAQKLVNTNDIEVAIL